jgi:hypothetical protein
MKTRLDQSARRTMPYNHITTDQIQLAKSRQIDISVNSLTKSNFTTGILGRNFVQQLLLQFVETLTSHFVIVEK